MKTTGSGFSLKGYGGIKEIDISVKDVALDYFAAKTLALKTAGDALLVSWYDGKHNVGYPEVHECTGDKPGWFAYALSHGGNLGVNINNGEFIFVFTTGF